MVPVLAVSVQLLSLRILSLCLVLFPAHGLHTLHPVEKEDVCTRYSPITGKISVTQEPGGFGVWERVLTLEAVPHEIESRCRCKEWGSDSMRPTTSSARCKVDQRYFVGSKRTMLAAMLAVRPGDFWTSGVRVLVIGLGGGSQPMQYRSLFPRSELSVVEIDPAVERVAKECFGFVKDNHTRVYIEDATQFVQRKSKPGVGSLRGLFDVIINDVPNPVDPAATTSIFASSTFLRHISELLSPQGIYVMNQNLEASGRGTVTPDTLSSAGFGHSLFFNNVEVMRSLVVASGSGSLAQTPKAWESSIRANTAALGLDRPDEKWRSSTAFVRELQEARGG